MSKERVRREKRWKDVQAKSKIVQHTIDKYYKIQNQFLSELDENNVD